ncbi:MAG TPA: hypothetical protein PKK50_02350, partial [Myxococcota bacterium]|nr:hypothetical protein [Myxococcota bacterium]
PPEQDRMTADTKSITAASARRREVALQTQLIPASKQPETTLRITFLFLFWTLSIPDIRFRQRDRFC